MRTATVALLAAATAAAWFLFRRSDNPGTGAEGGSQESGSQAPLFGGGGAMKLSSAGLAMIAELEGFSATPYPDYKGFSIGFGHLIRAGESYTQVSRDEATQLLLADVAWAEDVVNSSVSVPLTQEQFDALASLAFNIGEKEFTHSTLLRLLNDGDYQGAAAQFDRWNRAGGAVNESLIRRRARERELFQGGIAT